VAEPTVLPKDQSPERKELQSEGRKEGSRGDYRERVLRPDTNRQRNRDPRKSTQGTQWTELKARKGEPEVDWLMDIRNTGQNKRTAGGRESDDEKAGAEPWEPHVRSPRGGTDGPPKGPIAERNLTRE
jgi:hypothetical protein